MQFVDSTSGGSDQGDSFLMSSELSGNQGCIEEERLPSRAASREEEWEMNEKQEDRK